MKNIKNKAFIAVASLLALQGAAFAQSTPDTGWYMGASVGRSSIKPDLGPVGAGITEDKTSTGYKITGGYQFNPNFAVEGQYQDLGKYSLTWPSVTTLTIKDQALSAAAVGFLPLDKGFSLIGKAGIAINFLKADASGFGSFSESKTKASLLLGVGAEYALTPTVALRAEYEYFGQPKVDGTKVKPTLVSAGLRVRF